MDRSNEIERMQNLNELKELRVLNLGGNKIMALENIEKLSLLTELNLRRNYIERIGAIGKMPSLQRLFLSNNKIEDLEALEPLFQVRIAALCRLHELPDGRSRQVSSITELRLDCNDVCDSNQPEYRARMIRSFPALKHLDLKTLTEAERRDSLHHFSQAKIASKERAELEEAHRAHVIACAKANWERREAGSSWPSSLAPKASRDSGMAMSPWGCSQLPSTVSSSCREERESKPTSREDLTVHNSKTGFSEIEVHGEFRVLVVYGDALEVLESAKAHALVNAITFRYVSIEKISSMATSSSSCNLKLFGRLRRLNFAHNDIELFDQLQWLSTLGTKAEEVRGRSPLA